MSSARYAVFCDGKNRFVVPSYAIFDDDPDAPLASDIWCKAMSFGFATGATFEKERLVVPIEDGRAVFPHVVSEMRSRGLFLGACTVYLISGPEFDKVQQELESACP